MHHKRLPELNATLHSLARASGAARLRVTVAQALDASDAPAAEATAALLNRIKENRAVIVIEHDMDFVKDIGRKVTVLHQGKILAEGPMEKVQSDERVIEVYLGH